MTELPPTKFQQYYYDAEKGESVLVREGVLERIDPATLSPRLQQVLARLREEGKQFEQSLREQARQRKSS